MMMLCEQWLPISGYERYQVSNWGRVRSKRKVLVLHPNGKGYLRTLVYNGIWGISKKTRKNIMVHVAVMKAFVGSRPEGFEVNHKDKDKTNNRLENLEYCTQEENIYHRDHFVPFTEEEEEDLPF